MEMLHILQHLRFSISTTFWASLCTKVSKMKFLFENFNACMGQYRYGGLHIAKYWDHVSNNCDYISFVAQSSIHTKNSNLLCTELFIKQLSHYFWRQRILFRFEDKCECFEYFCKNLWTQTVWLCQRGNLFVFSLN